MKRKLPPTLIISVRLLLIFLLFFCKLPTQTGLIVSAGDEAIITRDLSNFQSLNQEFQVNLKLSVNKKITAIGIEETFPRGATITYCSEPNYKIIGNTLEILIFNPKGNIAPKVITYNLTLTSPGDFAGKWDSTESKSDKIILGNKGIKTIEESSRGGTIQNRTLRNLNTMRISLPLLSLLAIGITLHFQKKTITNFKIALL